MSMSNGNEKLKNDLDAAITEQSREEVAFNKSNAAWEAQKKRIIKFRDGNTFSNGGFISTEAEQKYKGMLVEMEEYEFSPDSSQRLGALARLRQIKQRISDLTMEYNFESEGDHPIYRYIAAGAPAEILNFWAGHGYRVRYDTIVAGEKKTLLENTDKQEGI